MNLDSSVIKLRWRIARRTFSSFSLNARTGREPRCGHEQPRPADRGGCQPAQARRTGMQFRNNLRAPGNLSFVSLIIILSVIFWRSWVEVAAAAFHNDQYSHILLVLPVSVALLYLERRRVFRNVTCCLPAGVILVLLWAASVWIARYPLPLSENDAHSLRMTFFVGCCVAAFVLCYGISAVRAAPIPLLLPFLMVPIPDFVLERTIWLLQRGSTDMTFLLLKAANIPVLRKDFVLSLPGIDIEVARECSGIHSSLVLFIVSLVLGHLFLQSSWRKILLAVLAWLVAVAKNGLRIFTLSTLRIYVDPSVLNGDLHRHGGIPFFLAALGILILIVQWLRKSEKGMQKRDRHYPNPGDNLAFGKGDT